MARNNAYSRWVGMLRVVLPLFALAILSTLFLLSDPPDPERALPFAEVDVAQLAREQRLSEPHYAGVLPDGREITLVAEAAVPDFEVTDVIVTDILTGQIAMAEDETLHFDALSGRIDIARRIADLSGDVVAQISQGYTLYSDAMAVRLADGSMTSPGDVLVNGPGLVLTAGAMEAQGGADEAVVSFTGGVRVIYEPEG